MIMLFQTWLVALEKISQSYQIPTLPIAQLFPFTLENLGAVNKMVLLPYSQQRTKGGFSIHVFPLNNSEPLSTTFNPKKELECQFTLSG